MQKLLFYIGGSEAMLSQFRCKIFSVVCNLWLLNHHLSILGHCQVEELLLLILCKQLLRFAGVLHGLLKVVKVVP